MGFWSTVADLAVSVMEGMSLSQAHPALQKAWDRYAAKGYSIVNVDTYEVTGRKEGMFTVSTVTLRVDADGSVLVEEDGALTVSVYMIPAGPTTPTIAAFEATRAQAHAQRAAGDQQGGASSSSSRSHSGGSKPGAQGSRPGAEESRALKLLGLSRGATAKQVKAAYRAKAQAYHPDVYSSAPQEFRDLAHRKMAELNAARDLLLKA